MSQKSGGEEERMYRVFEGDIFGIPDDHAHLEVPWDGRTDFDLRMGCCLLGCHYVFAYQREEEKKNIYYIFLLF